MRLVLSLFLLLFLNNCSLNKDSQYWTKDPLKKIDEQNKFLEILNKSKDIRTMTFNEYKIYIEDYTKKSNYPDISK